MVLSRNSPWLYDGVTTEITGHSAAAMGSDPREVSSPDTNSPMASEVQRLTGNLAGRESPYRA